MMSLLAFPTSCVGWCARLNSPLYNCVLRVPGAVSRVMLDTEVVKTVQAGVSSKLLERFGNGVLFCATKPGSMQFE